MMSAKNDDEVILTELPQALWVELEAGTKKQIPNVPPNWFPLTPVSNVWCLDLSLIHI